MTSRITRDAVAVVQNLPVAAISTPTLTIKNDKGLSKKYSKGFYKAPPANATIADNVFLFDVCATPRNDIMADFGKGYDTTSDTNTSGFIPTSSSPNIPVPVISDFIDKVTDPALRKEYIKQMTLDMYFFSGVSGGNHDATIGLGQSTDNAGFPLFVRGYSTVPLEKIRPNQPDYNFCEPLCLNISDVIDEDERSAMNDKRFSYGSCLPFTLAPFDYKDLYMSVLASTKFYSYYRHIPRSFSKLTASEQHEVEESKFLKRQFSVANKVENGLSGLVLLLMTSLGFTEYDIYARINDSLGRYDPKIHKKQDKTNKRSEESDVEARGGVNFYGKVFAAEPNLNNDNDKKKLLKLLSMKLIDMIESIESQTKQSESERVSFTEFGYNHQFSPFSQKRMIYSFRSLVDGLGEQFQLRAPVAHYMGRNNAIFPDGSIRTEAQIKY